MKLLTRTEDELKDFIEKNILSESMNFEIVRINKYRVLQVWDLSNPEVDVVRLAFNLPAHVAQDNNGDILFISASAEKPLRMQ